MDAWDVLLGRMGYLYPVYDSIQSAFVGELLGYGLTPFLHSYTNSVGT